MSAPALSGMDAKAMLQELKSNRKIQIALVAGVLMLWYVWPSSPQAPAKGGAARRAAVPLGERQERDLAKLPDLDKLNRAGELPTEDRMLRDLFMFDGPKPPPPPQKPVKYEPPPPPTPEQLAEQARAADKAQENAAKPQDLRFLGYLATAKAGRYGAFVKADEPYTYRQGDLVNPKWRLVKVTDTFAEFQNLKYPDLKYRIDAVEPRGGGASGPVNEF